MTMARVHHRDKQYSNAHRSHVEVIMRGEKQWTAVIYDIYRASLTALYIVADAIEYKYHIYIYIHTHTYIHPHYYYYYRIDIQILRT